MNKQLVVSSSPHIRVNTSTMRIMLDVIIALLPTTVMGVILFGAKALGVIIACVLSSVLGEFLFNLIAKKKQTIGDLSAVVTGLLLALNLNAEVPIWQCIIGSLFAIVVVKCLFGGLGCNFANPAITGRIFMMLCFTTTVGKTVSITFGKQEVIDLTTSATPLQLLSNEGDALPSLLDMFLGFKSGAIGEVCGAAILIGFIYLIIRRVINFEVPLVFVGGVFVLSLIIGGGNPVLALYQVLSGGLLLGAVFMATDYVTTPITRLGKIIFAFGCAVITVLIRYYGSYPEGVSYAILVMNILSPYIEKWTLKRPLGGAKE